jgi:ketosteroid isomerase-like protein
MRLNRRKVLGVGIPAVVAMAAGGAKAREAGGGELCMVLSVQQEFSKAVAARDKKQVAAILAPDFTSTDPTGHVWDRDRYLEHVGAGASAVSSIELGELDGRLRQNVAVVTGINQYHTDPHRPALDGRFRFTNTYVKQGDNWNCLAAHECRISG